MTSPQASNARKIATLRDLPQSVDPPRDLWPGIEAELRASAADTAAARPRLVARAASGMRVPRRYLAAAAMVGCVAVGVWIGRSVLPGAAGTAGPPLAGLLTPTATGEIANTVAAAYVSDPRYQHQRAALVRSLEERLAAMPPLTRAKVMASLATLEQAKADIEQALGRDPGNALLQELLVDTYQDEMRVLTDVHEASDAGRGI